MGDRGNNMNCQYVYYSVEANPIAANKLEEHLFSKHKMARFACGMCPEQPSSSFDTIDKVREHVEIVHTIHGKEIIDKLIKLPQSDNLKSYKCVACPSTAR